ELVQKIAQQVLRAIQAQAGEAAGGPKAEGPAPIQPPAGVCTGDYSKFPELVGRSVGARPQAAPTVIALSGIVTAAQLEAAIKASSDGVAVLAPDARLTPLANDLVRQKPGCIRRADAAPAA